MKHLLKFLGMAIPVVLVMNSCSPTVTPEPPTTLNQNKTGKTMGTKDTNTYNYALSCGCPFELKVDSLDTASIHYNFGNMATSFTSHLIKAFPKPGLTKGTYTGWVAVVTLKPDTNPDLRDTMRDTVIVP